MISINEDVSRNVSSISHLIMDKTKFFQNIIDKYDCQSAKSLASIKFSIYIHANHKDCTRDLMIVLSLKHKIERKHVCHSTHTCRVCTIGFVDLIHTWHGISSCYYLESKTAMINAMITDCL